MVLAQQIGYNSRMLLSTIKNIYLIGLPDKFACNETGKTMHHYLQFPLFE